MADKIPKLQELLVNKDYQLYINGDMRVERTTAGIYLKQGEELCFLSTMPRIPKSIYDAIIECFIEHADMEYAFQIFWDRYEWRYLLVEPPQTRRVTEVRFSPAFASSLEELDRYEAIMDVHSHGRIAAFWSAQDNADEVATRLYMVVGNIRDNTSYRILLRAGTGGAFCDVPVNSIFCV